MKGGKGRDEGGMWRDEERKGRGKASESWRRKELNGRMKKLKTGGKRKEKRSRKRRRRNRER